MESNESKCQEQCTLIISHITFRDFRVHIFPTTFLEIPLSAYAKLTQKSPCLNTIYKPSLLVLSTKSKQRRLKYAISGTQPRFVLRAWLYTT